MFVHAQPGCVRSRVIGLVFGFATAVMGCGGGGGAPAGPFSCVASFSDAGAAAPAVCLDVTGGTEQDLENDRQMCAAQGNQFRTELCPHANALGGCRVSQGHLTITTWYYGDGSSSADEIRQLCAGINVPYVAP
jgi:hypothetical protein